MVTVQMGSYGVGVSRLVGAIIEASHDEAGSSGRCRWRRSRSASSISRPATRDTDRACAGLYRASSSNAGIDVLYDDTDERAGAKFATMDLIGLPWQLIVGPKGVKSGEVEVKERKTGARETLSPEPP